MIGLANRVRMTIERSPVPLDPFSVTMNGLHQLLLLPRRFWPRKVFMSRRSVIRAQQNPTTNSLHAYDRKEGSGLRSHASILKSAAVLQPLLQRRVKPLPSHEIRTEGWDAGVRG